MSRIRSFDRGRSALAARRVTVAPVVTVAAFREFWAALLARHCGTATEISRVFDVTLQTGANWLDEFSTPTGDKVLMAVRLWPEEFGLGDVAEAA
jgi:hypothetical protein